MSLCSFDAVGIGEETIQLYQADASDNDCNYVFELTVFQNGIWDLRRF